MRRTTEIMDDLIASGLTARQIAMLAELAMAAAVEAVKAPEETPEQKKKRISRETSARHRVSLRVTNASPETESPDVTERHEMSPGDTNASPPRVRVEDITLTKVLSGITAAVDAREIGDTEDWPKVSKLAEHLASLIESPLLDPQKSHGLVSAGRLLAWKAAGASWEHDVLPIVGGLSRKARGRINAWGYFDDAISQSIADNRRALEIPAARATGPPSLASYTDRMAADHAESKRLALAELERRHG